MKKVVVVAAVAVLVVAGAVAVVLSGGKDSSKNSSANAPGTSGTSSGQNSDQSKTATPASTNGVETVSVNANDESATPEIINVKKGDKVTITFNVLENGTYHGGLQFTSVDPAVASDPILPGKSGDVTFTANKSFDFTPYWYQSSIKKDYVVAVKVQ